MASLSLGQLPSLRKQHLLSEFAGLKQVCPEGVFVSLTPGDPSLWSAVLFVRDGEAQLQRPYAPAVMRFQICFPDSYPRLPPLVSFSTDMFHPLITPLTTYMYTTDIQDNGTVSATDEERLQPGGFSLRHGFPEWFGRGRRSLILGSRKTSDDQAPGSPLGLASPGLTSNADTSEFPARILPGYMHTKQKSPSIFNILKYIRSTFDDAEVLDTVPLDAAGNPGAWHAWRTHRQKANKLTGDAPQTDKPVNDQAAHITPVASPRKGAFSPTKDTRPSTAPRQPGEWNWDGVWEDRVKKGVASSLSEPVLFGATGADELIHFLPMEDTDVDSVKDNLIRTLGSAS